MNKKLFRKLIFTKADAVLEILGYVFFLAAFLVAAAACAAAVPIPEKIDMDGNVIRYGSPGILFLMPAALLLCNLLFSLVLHVSDPNTWNMPFKLCPGRELVIYRDMVRMLTVLELEFGLFSLGYTVILWRWKEALLFITVSYIIGVLGDIGGMLAVASRHNRKV